MNCVFLIFAILFEVVGTTVMKISNGFTKPIQSVLFLFAIWVVYHCLHWHLNIFKLVWRMQFGLELE